MFKRVQAAALLAALPLTIGFAQPVAAIETADDGVVQPAPAPEELVFEAEALVESFTRDGRLLGAQVHGSETQNLDLASPMPAKNGKPGDVSANASGSGGSSSASGCTKVTVHNEAETLLGFTAYYFDTWTRWCWTRSTARVYDVTHGWDIHSVDSQQYWKGIVNKETHLYDWKSGDSDSGYYHMRQGQFENCVLKYGCIGTTYPKNIIRSHSDGTWTWATSGT